MTSVAFWMKGRGMNGRDAWAAESVRSPARIRHARVQPFRVNGGY
jgi:hypothetical protein